MTRRNVTSPEASGGAGTLFEYRVAAVMLGHLLRGSHPPGLQVPVVRVGLQQRALGHLLDDIVLYGEPGSVCTEFQVKRTVRATGADQNFVDVVEQALHVLHDRDKEVADGELSLGLIARGTAAAVDELATLAEWAEGHSSFESYEKVFQPGAIDVRYRRRLAHVREAVAAAVARGAPDLGGYEPATHRLLAALQVWRPMLSENGADYRRALDDLQPIAAEFDLSPSSFFDRLAAVAQAWGPVASVVDADAIRRRLRRRGLRSPVDDGSGQSQTLEGVDADAVVRGPILALGLKDDLERAEALLATADPVAVDIFGAIEERLRKARFVPHANMMLRKRANALDRAGRHDEAAMARAGMAWDELDRVRPWEAGFALHDGRGPGPIPVLGPAADRVQVVASAAVDVAKGGSGLDRLATAFDEAHDTDRYILRAAVCLCEEALAADQPALIHERRRRLDSLVTRSSKGNATDIDYGFRLQMCLADATGAWLDTLREVHRRLPREAVAWAYARYARYLALSGDGPGAQENYLEAIERASTHNMADEAADWLYALRTVRFWYEDWANDDEHPLAQVVRDRARHSALPGAPHTAELALHTLLEDDKPQEALQRARRWQWQSTVRAQLADELSAARAVGLAKQKLNDIVGALYRYVRAGSEDDARAAAKLLPEQAADLSPSMLTLVPARQAVAYAVASAAIDLIPDDQSRQWAHAALKQILRSRAPRPLSGPSPYIRAFDLLAVACKLLDRPSQDTLTSAIEPLIERPPNRYWPMDEAVARILVSLAVSRPELIPMLCRALIADQRMAAIIVADIATLKPHASLVLESLRPFAGSSRDACLAIIRVGADPSVALPLAESQVHQVLRPRVHAPGTITGHMGAADEAVLASVLDLDTRNLFARTMLQRATDSRESKFSRWNDLAGLANIATDIDQDVARQMVPQVLTIARGEAEVGPERDPYRAISLQALALQTATMLGPDVQQWFEIEQVGTAYLLTADGSEQWRVVQALVRVPAERSTLNLQQCAAHPLPALRTLAAIRWAENANALPTAQASALARDLDYRVRRELARALASAVARTPEQSDVLDDLAVDPRRSIRLIAGKVGHEANQV